MEYIRKTFLTIVGLVLMTMAYAQPIYDEPEMADALRADGKIWVVVTVIGIIFIGIIAYLIRMDRKLKAFEDKIEESNS